MNDWTNEGDCYETAANMVVDLALAGSTSAVLVHGMPWLQRPPFGYFGHAWVEIGETVLDYANGRRITCSRREYYAIGKIDPDNCFQYTAEEARKMLTRYRHYGPWEGPEGVPPSTEEE